MTDSRSRDGVIEADPPADRPEPLEEREPLGDEVERVLAALYGDDDDLAGGFPLGQGVRGPARNAGATP